MAVTFPSVGSKGDDTGIQAPLLVDRCMESSSGIAGDKPEVLLFLQTGKLSAVTRAGLFYILK